MHQHVLTVNVSITSSPLCHRGSEKSLIYSPESHLSGKKKRIMSAPNVKIM